MRSDQPSNDRDSTQRALQVGGVPTLIIGVAVVLGFAARLLSASVGDNYDMQSWWIASEAFRAGEPIYTATHRYNYGPIWFGVIGGLRELSACTGPDTIHRLHLFLTAFLSIVDLGLAAIVSRATSPLIGILFFLNPVSLAVTGYHIQFDNFAVLVGLLSWLSFTSPSRSPRQVIVAGLLFGLSLSIKHVFSLFLAWLPALKSVRSLRERLLFGAVGLSVFLLSFAPWVGDESAWLGIKANVFGYLSTEGHSLTSDLAALTPTIPARPLFIVLLTVSGGLLLWRPASHRRAPYLYLVLLTALSSGMARNYLAIPLMAIFSLPRAHSFSIYLLVASLTFISDSPGLGSTEVIAPIISSPMLTYELAQALLLAGALEVSPRTPRGA